MEEKKDFQDLSNAEIMKANLLKKITSNTLITTNIEEKRNLVLNLIELTMINQEEKRDLVLNLIELTMINQEEKRNLGLKSTDGAVEIEPFKY